MESDLAWAEWIAWHLEAEGYRVLIRAWDLVAGSNRLATMEKAVRASERTLAVLSSSYLTSVAEQPFWRAAVLADPEGVLRKLLPIQIEKCDIMGLLDHVAVLDLVGLDPDGARERLVEAVSQTVHGRAKPAVPPRYPGE